eukprot:scaffold2012_cov228-Pinguiococcus_pyrenoidosus.AAC.14
MSYDMRMTSTWSCAWEEFWAARRMRRGLVLLLLTAGLAGVRCADPYARYDRYDRYESVRRAPPRVYEEEEERYEPRRQRRPQRDHVGMSALRKGNKKYGIMCIGGGTVVTMLGITLMFEKNLMRLGNLLQVAGLALLLGPARLVSYMMQRSKLRGAMVFATGFTFIMNGRSFIGFFLELFGIINLFGNMFPVLWNLVQRMPIVRELNRKSEF